jgi:hypothetical protein
MRLGCAGHYFSCSNAIQLRWVAEKPPLQAVLVSSLLVGLLCVSSCYVSSCLPCWWDCYVSSCLPCWWDCYVSALVAFTFLRSAACRNVSAQRTCSYSHIFFFWLLFRQSYLLHRHSRFSAPEKTTRRCMFCSIALAVSSCLSLEYSVRPWRSRW